VSTARESPIPLQHRLTVRLTAAVILVLLLIGVPFLLAFHTLRRAQQLDALTEATNGIGQVVVDGLRSAMLADEPHLLDGAVRRLADREQIEQVMLLDHTGELRVSSSEGLEGRPLDRELDRNCAVCHRQGASPPASRTIVTGEGEGRVLRSMTIIPNEAECHGCHDPAIAVNGVLLMDLALGTTDRRFFAGIGGTVILGTVMVLLTILVLVLLLRRMVHSPLQAVVETSQRIVAGDLDARVSVPGSGEFARVASRVNRMTTHLSRSIRTVETQHRELQAILDAVDDEIVVLDRDRRVVAANEAFRRESGQSGRETPSTDPDSPVQRVFETGRLQKGIVSSTLPDGRERVIEIHASPVRGPEGEVTRAVEVRRDISERRQMEAVVAQSERLASLGLLASGLSHEINNPLGAIATSVEGLRRRLPGEPGISAEAARALDEVLSRIGKEVDRGRTITHRLLKIARPPGTARSLADTNHVVEEIVAVLSHDIKRSGIAPRLELDRSLPPLRADGARLGQVVMNLTLNAIQAMADAGGELRISTSVVDGSIQMEFEDSGCGIRAELFRRIFEPFFTTKPVGKGTGLGLFITHQIVSDMGGSIRVRSEPGEGTCFTVRIPQDAGVNQT
jgi:PAS domain S-box-containing protein